MRNKHRIEPFLSRVDIGLLIATIGGFKRPEEALEYQKLVEDYIATPAFINEWLDNPDLRFGQNMYNEGFELFDKFYYYQEAELLKLCGYTNSESYMWGSNYNEDGTESKETLYKFIDELDDKHLANMVDEANNGTRFYHPFYVDIFCEELLRRGFVNYKLIDEVREKFLNKRNETHDQRMLEFLDLYKHILE